MQLGPDGLMPGMATQAEIAKLEPLTGKALDVFFLQLMIRHHQGGLPMAQYGAEHASRPTCATPRRSQAQSAEILLMERLLRERGASPLPAVLTLGFAGRWRWSWAGPVSRPVRLMAFLFDEVLAGSSTARWPRFDQGRRPP